MFQMNFEDAMYNCLLRRSSLVAFEEDSELHSYWFNSTYFQNAFDLGSSLGFVVLGSFENSSV
jgi:hypothetical protein